MSLGEVDQALMSLRDNMDKPPPYQARIDYPYESPHLFDEATGSVMTHRMSQMDNYAYPMIQQQPDGTLKDFGEDKFGAWEEAKKAGNFKKFDTIPEAEAYAEGGYKTPELEHYGKVESKHARTGNRQEAWPEYYFEPGLGNVAPVIEFGFGGLARAGTSAITKTKMYSDQIVDRFTKIKTPRTVHHGGEANVSTLKTTYDRSIEGQKIDNTMGHRLASEDGVTKTRYSPFQAALYTGSKSTARNYRWGPNKSLYKISTSQAKKIYNHGKPSKYMQKELKKEIKLAEEAEDFRKSAELKFLEGKPDRYMSHVSPSQRDFLEKYGYDAIRTKDPTGPATLLFRPEKYKIKELP